MKHAFSRLISLMLILCLLAPAALAEAPDDGPVILEAMTDSIRNLFLHNGTLYAQTYFDQLYRQVEGGWQLSGGYPDNDYDILSVYTSGEDVWFLVRREGDSQMRTCYQIILAAFDESGAVTAPENPLTIDWNIDPDNWPNVYGFVVSDGAAYILAEHPDDWSRNVLYRADMTTGEAAILSEEPLEFLTGYKDGLLLATRFSWDETDDNGDFLPPQAVVVNPATAEITQLSYMTTPEGNSFNVGGLTYDTETDSVYYSDGCHAYRIVGDAPEMVGYLPPSNMSRQGSAGLVHQGRYYVADYREASSTSIDPALAPQRVLRIQESWSLDDGVLRGFIKLHPDIAIEYVGGHWSDLESFNRLMQSDNAPDVFSTSMDSDFTVIRDKKYLIDLSSSEVLMNLVSSMYPHLTSELLKDGQLFALPIHLEAYTYGYYPRAFEKAGVPLDTVPTTYDELLDFIVTWHDEYYDDNEGMEVLQYTSNIRLELFYDICNSLELGSQNQEILTYDTPTMRHLLARLDELVPIFDDVTPYSEDDDYEYIEDNSLFTTMDSDPLPRLYRMSEDSLHPMTLALDEQTPPVIAVNMDVLGVNPFTNNTDAAIELLEYISQNLSIRLLTAMIPEQNDPIEVYDYERTYQRQKERVAELEAQLETAPAESRSELEDDLEWARKYLDSLEGDGRWAMTTEEILWYREHTAPYLALRTSIYSSANASNQMHGLRQRYLDGQLSADDFIQEMESIVWIVQQERK